LSNTVWKFNSKFGMAYLESKDLAEGILKMAGSRIDAGVAATYYSPGGRAFAWQVCFNIEQLDKVSCYLGLEPQRSKPQIKKANISKKGRSTVNFANSACRNKKRIRKKE
jgi:hypothetical protein